MTILSLENQKVRIDEGELVGYSVDGYELIHQKGNAGWRNSDTEMFPIIGPTNEAEFKVKTPKGEAVQDQHGLLRELAYDLVDASKTKAVYEKRYLANTKVKNSKFPEKSTEPELFWPYDFNFVKSYYLNEKCLEIRFEINGEDGMPFMLGYHPAFNLAIENPLIKTQEKEISIPQVMAVGSRALQVPNQSSIELKGRVNLSITTEGFEHFMLWTEVPNMVCIEPITFYPYEVEQANLDKGFHYVKESHPITFKVYLQPK